MSIEKSTLSLAPQALMLLINLRPKHLAWQACDVFSESELPGNELVLFLIEVALSYSFYGNAWSLFEFRN